MSFGHSHRSYVPFVLQTFLGTLFITLLVILPQILEVNRLNPILLGFALAPLCLLRLAGFSSSWALNPALLYTLWLTNSDMTWSLWTRMRLRVTSSIAYMLGFILPTTILQGLSLIHGDELSEVFEKASPVTFPLSHVLSTIVAAMMAGAICNYFFPDDPTTWIRKQ